MHTIATNLTNVSAECKLLIIIIQAEPSTSSPATGNAGHKLATTIPTTGTPRSANAFAIHKNAQWVSIGTMLLAVAIAMEFQREK